MMTTHAPNAPWPQFVFIPQPRPKESNDEPAQKASQQKVKLSDRILDYLEEHPGSYSNAMANDLGLEYSTVTSRLRDLEKSHAIKKQRGDMVSRGGFLMYQYWSLR